MATFEKDKKLGDYRLVARISDGAQATIYEASAADGTRVALKVFKSVTDDDTAEIRFSREAEILRRLSHRNIVRYRDSFTTEGEWGERQNCLAMEYLEGNTLQDLMKKHPKGMPWQEARDLMEQCLAGLIYAKEKHGITHRDIKPSNIFILEDGHVKLLDYGIARIEGGTTKTGASVMGSFDYMAPDFALTDRFQTHDDGPFRGDHISDIFSLTVCFYEMLTGRLPWSRFEAQAEVEYFGRWRADKPKRPSHSPICFRVIRHLGVLIDKGLTADRSARFQDFPPLLDALRELRPRVISHKGKDQYELVQGLEKGGFGEVYKARRKRDGELVAIKRLFSDRAPRRFVKEADLLRRYSHPHLVEYSDFFQSTDSAGNKQLFLVMEFLDGMPQWSLRNRIKDEGALDVGEVMEFFCHYLDALQYLHENVNQIIHRDIKPGNLYAPKDSTANAKILDLGVAKDVTGTQTSGATPGTWRYMAPEFITANSRGTPQSDIYGLGLSLYEALAGVPAFPRTSKSNQEAAAEYVARATGKKKVVVQFTHEVFKEHPSLEGIIKKSIHRNPAKRFGSAAEVRNELVQCLKDMGKVDGLEFEDFEEADETMAADGTAATRPATLATLFGGTAETAFDWRHHVAREKTRRSFKVGILAVCLALAGAISIWALVISRRGPEIPAPLPTKPPVKPAVVVQAPPVTAPVSLHGSLRVRTDPLVDVVAISDAGTRIAVGQTDASGLIESRLEEGEYALVMHKKHYAAATNHIVISKKDAVEVRATLLPLPGKLKIASSLPAEIWEGTKKLGMTGEVITEIKAGQHTLTLKRRGYRDATLRVPLRPEEHVELTAPELAARVGTVAIATEMVASMSTYSEKLPVEAQFRIDTKPWKRIPLPYKAAVPIAEPHQIAVKVLGYTVSPPETIQATEGKTVNISFTLTPEPGRVTINANAADAQVFKGNMPLGKVGAELSLAPFMDHVLDVVATDYRTKRITMSLAKPGQSHADTFVHLERESGILRVVAKTPQPDHGELKGTIIVDGKDLGEHVLPYETGPLPVGAHTVQLRANTWRPVTQRKVAIEDNKTASVVFSLLPHPGILQIRARPRGAEVLVDGKRIAATTTKVVPGVGHKIEVRKKGYRAQTQMLVVAAGQTRVVDITLDKLPSRPKPPLRRPHVVLPP